jgi:hypothetical protein
MGEVDYIVGEPESNNYVLNTTTLYASFLNNATGYGSGDILVNGLTGVRR